MLSSQDVESLEKRRFRLKVKNFFKFFIPLIVLSLIAVGSFFIFPNLSKIKDIRLSLKDNNPSIKKEEVVELKQPLVKIEETKKSEPEKIEVVKKILIKKDDTPKIEEKKKTNANKIANANAISSKKENQNTIKLHKKFLKVEDSQAKKIKKEKVEKKKAVIKIDSKVFVPTQKRDKEPIKFAKNSKINYEGKNIDYLKQRFRNTNRFSYSISIAEEYYKKGEYPKSIKWSLISNDLNSKDARSWVFFAKSKVKLGKKNEAVEALKMFLKTHKSRPAEHLMNRIEHGAL